MKQNLVSHSIFNRRRRRNAWAIAALLFAFCIGGPNAQAQIFGCAAGPDQNNCNNGDENTITNVAFTALVPVNNNNVASGCNNAPFSDFSATPIGTVVAGNTISVNVSYSTDGTLDNQAIGVWLDYDNDGVADDFQTQFIANSAGGVATLNFTIPPVTITNPAALMLVRLIANVGALTAADACTDFTGTGRGESELYSISIVSAPFNFTGPTFVCVGGTLQLLATNTVPGVVYKITGPNGYSYTFVGDGTSPSITVTNAAAQVHDGVYSITENGILTFTVDVNVGAPIVSSNSPVCVGGTLLLTVQGTVAGSTYDWTGPNGFTANFVGSGADITTPVTITTAADLGLFTLTVDGVLSCVAINATQKPSPLVNVISNGPICDGATLILTATDIPGATYSFRNPAGAIVTQSGNVFSKTVDRFFDDGFWQVDLVDADGCAAVSPAAILPVTVNATPITPFAFSNAPICGVGNLSINVVTGVGLNYHLSGPGGFDIDIVGNGGVQTFTITNASSANAGLYTLSATDALGCKSADFQFQVEVIDLAIPTFTISNPSPCTEPTTGAPGQTVVTYNGPTLPMGTTYTWTCDGCDQDVAGTGIMLGASIPLTLSWNMNGQVQGVKNVSLTVTVPNSTGSCMSPTGVQSVVVSLSPITGASNDGPVCEGDDIHLFAAPFPNVLYNWFNATGTFTSFLQNPIIYNATAADAGVYSLLAFDITTNCFSNFEQTTVVVHPKPAAPVFSSNTPVCEGGQLDLTVTGSTAGATYQITGPNGYSDIFVGTGGNDTRSITNITSANIGSYTVSLVDVNNCSSDASTTQVDLAPKPSMTIVSDSPICQGANLTITVTANITVPYTIDTYAPDGTFFGTVPIAAQIYSITGPLPAGPGVYTYQVRNSAGCVSDFVALTVVEKPVPVAVATNGGAVCLGGTINLFAQTVTGGTYAWTGPNGFASSDQNPTRANATAADAGDYSLTVTLNGCASAQVTTTVTVNAQPAAPGVATSTPVCEGSDLLLTATNTNAGEVYTWTGPNGYTSGFTSAGAPVTTTVPAVTAANAGTYILSYTRNGCPSATTATQVVVNPNPVLTLTNNGPVCEGAVATFLAEPALTTASYFYFNPLGVLISGPSLSSALATVVTAATDAGVWTATVTDVNGCVSNVAKSLLVINPLPTATITTPNTCRNEATTITYTGNATPSATYQWTFGADATPSGTVGQGPHSVSWSNAHAAGTPVTLTVTDVNGCSALVSQNITVHNNLAPTISTNLPIVVCEGRPLDFAALGISITNPAGNGQRDIIVTGPNGFTQTLNNVPGNTSVSPAFFAAITTAQAGVYSMVTRRNNAPFCDSDVTNFTVNVVPQPTLTASSNAPVCEGATLTLTATQYPGATYTFTDPTGGVTMQAASMLSVTAVQATHNGDWTISVTDANGCASLNATLPVVINAAPAPSALSSNTPVCEGNTLMITALGTTFGLSYQWTGPNGYSQNFIGTGLPSSFNLANVTAANAGDYSLTVTQNGCTSFSTTTVVVNPNPTASFTLSRTETCFSSVDPIVATYTGTGATTFTWNCDGCDAPGPLGVSQEGFLYSTALFPGQKFISLMVADGNGCTASASAQAITVKIDPNLSVSNNSPLCAGETLQLTASGDANYPGLLYTWIEPVSGFNSALQNPTILNVAMGNAGTYTLIAFDPVSLCPVNALNTIVTVNPLPIAVPTSNSPVCAGNMINLTETTGGFSQWMWTGPGGFGSANQNPNIANATAANAGTYTVSVIDANGCESLPASTEVIVNTPAVVTLTNNGPICDGANVTFVAEPLLMSANYSFTSPLGVVNGPFTNNVLINAVFAGTDDGVWTVDVLDVNGCASNSAQTTLVITPTPIAIATNGGAVCIGGTIQLFAETVTGASYAWSGPNGFTSSAQNPTRTNATAADAGDYSLTVTLNGCASIQVTTTVTVNPLPIAAPTSNSPVCAGGTINLMEATAGITQWMWTGPMGFSSVNQNPNIANATMANAGTYTVSVIDANGCMSLPVSTEVIVNTTPVITLTNSGPVCENSPLALTATQVPGATYTFTSPTATVSMISANILSIGAAALTDGGDWTVTATVGACVSTPVVSNVVVNPAPATPTLTASGTFFCEGDVFNNPLVLDPGVTTVGAFYTLTGPNNYIVTFTGDGSGAQQQFIVSPTLANSGTYFLSVNLNGCTAQTASLQITINPIPPVGLTASATTVCAGEPVIFTPNDPQNFNYIYQFFDGVATNFGSYGPYVVTYPTASTQQVYTASYFVFEGITGCFDFLNIPITVNPQPIAPTVTTNSPLCAGGSLILTVVNSELNANHVITGPNGYSFSFVGTGVDFPVTIANATTANAGAYTVSVTQNGCDGPSTSTTVVVNTTLTVNLTSNTPVCEGENLMLTATQIAGASYTFTNPVGGVIGPQASNVVNVVAVQATHNGDWSVVATAGACPSLAATATVVVNAAPVAPTVTVNPVCLGSTLSLTAMTTINGGDYVWTGPAYVQSFVGNGSDVTFFLPNVTAGNAGTYTLTLNQNGCTAFSTVDVVLTPNPTPIVTQIAGDLLAPYTACEGETVSFSETTSAFATYVWTGPNGVIPPFGPFPSTLFLNSVTTAHNGAYTLTVTDANGCSGSTTFQFEVYTLPPATFSLSNTQVCVAETLTTTYTGVAPQSAQYTYFCDLCDQDPGNAGITTATPGVQNFTWATTGVKTITLNVIDLGKFSDNSGSFCFSAFSQTVTVNAAPTASATSPVCAGNTLTLTASATVVGATYTWNGPGGFTQSFTGNGGTITTNITNMTSANAGFYTLSTTGGLCSATVQVVLSPAPVADFTLSNLETCQSSGTPITVVYNGTPGVTTFSWNCDGCDAPGALGASTENFFYSGSIPGLKNISLSVTDANGCVSNTATHTITLKSDPNLTASNNGPLCVGEDLFLTTSPDPNYPGMLYSWNGPSGFSSALANPSVTNVTGANAGIYQVFVFDPVSLCGPFIVSTTVTVNALPVITNGNNGPICAGATLNLTSSNIASGVYHWTGPNGFSSATQNPTLVNTTTANAGAYTVSVIDANGCTSNPLTTAVVINNTPVVTSLTSNTPVCLGSTLTLTATQIPGATYTFTNPALVSNNVASNQFSATATAAMTGVWSVTATVGGCVSATLSASVSVTAVPLAPSVSTNTPVCAGSPITLTANATTFGANYVWAGPGYTQSFVGSGGAVSFNIPNASTANAGNYTLTITQNGCSTFSTTAVVVTAIPVAALSNSGPVCSGTALTLTATPAGATSYSFTSPTGVVTTQASNTLSVASATASHDGNWTVTVTNGTCVSLPATTHVTVNQTPATPTPGSNSPICVGQQLQLFAPTVNNAVYTWSFSGGGFSSSLQNPIRNSATAAMAGTYSVTVTVNNCVSAAGSTVVTINAAPAAPSVTTSSPVCAGNTISLTALATVNGSTYQWTGPNGYSLTFTGTGGSVTQSIANASAANAGFYTLTVTTSGCGSAATTVQIVVNPTPSISAVSNAPICAGQNLLITATSLAGATYTFTNPAAGSTVQAGNVLSVAAATVATHNGVWTISATVNACPSNSVSLPVTINATPATPTVMASPGTTVCEGTNFSVSTAFVAGVTYQWFGPNGFSSTSPAPAAIINASSIHQGTYSVIETLGGCSSSAGTSTVTVTARPVATLANSGPVCSGTALTITALPVIAGATYAFTSPTGVVTSQVGNNTLSIASATASHNGSWTVTITNGACASLPATTVVTVNATPATPTPSNNTPICVGQTLQLTAPIVAGATYAWTGPSAFTSSLQNANRNNVTAVMGGLYSLVITVNGCASGQGTTNAIINSAPAAPTVSSNSPVCATGTLTLTASATVAASNYTWSGPNGYTQNFVGTGANEVFNITNVTAANAGDYSLTVSTSGCTSSVTTTNVVINARPTLTLAQNNGPVCQGQTLNITVQPSGLGTYTFVSPNGTTFNQASNIFSTAANTAVHNGTWNITVTSASSCVSTPITTAVVVTTGPATPTVSNSSPVCQGGSFQLFAPTIVGASYAWSGPDGWTSAAQSPTRNNVALTANGDYSLVVTVSGCASNIATTSVTINANPIPTIDQVALDIFAPYSLCEGEDLFFNETTFGFNAYSWTGPNGFADNINAFVFIPAATSANSGLYTLKVADFNGCIGTTSMSVLVNPVPTASFTLSDNTVCTGETVTTNYVGMNANFGAFYSWFCNGCDQDPFDSGIFVSTSEPQNFTWSTPGVKNVSLTVTNTTSSDISLTNCTSLTYDMTVTVNAAPAAPIVTSNGPVCEAGTITLTAVATTAAATYMWSGPNGFTQNFVGTGANVSFNITNATAANAGTYSLTVAQNGCTSAVATTNVVVNALPIALLANSGPVCEGSILGLQAFPIGQVSYDFISPTGNLFPNGGADALTLFPVLLADNGMWTVTITDANGCVSLPASTPVQVNATPVVAVSNNGPICEGASATLNVTTIAGAAYSWTQTGGTALAGFPSVVQNPMLMNVPAGVYTFDVTATSNACVSNVATTTLVVNARPVPVASNNGPVCVGATINLSETTGFAQYMWNGPNGFNSALQNPTIANATTANAGTYTLSVIDANGCTSLPVSTEVVVTPSLTLTLSNNGPVCDGATVTFVAEPFINGANYTFTSPLGVINGPFTTNVFMTSVFAGNDDGVWSADATLNGCASNTPQSTLIINLNPTAIATNGGAVCAGSTIQLFAQTVTGATYAWLGPNGFTSSMQNPTIANATAANAGLYSLTVTANGCASVQTTTNVVVNVNPTAALQNSGPICTGTALTLTATPAGAANYTFITPNGIPFNNGASATFTIASATAAHDGVWTVSVTYAGGCVNTATNHVTILTTPIVVATNSGPVCEGGTVTISAPTIPGAMYLWNETSGTLAGFPSNLQNVTITNIPFGIGFYDFNLTVSLNGCASASAATTITVNPLPAFTFIDITTGLPVTNQPLTICEGQNLALVTDLGLVPPANLTFSWSGPNGYASNQPIVNILSATTANSGTYSLTVTDNNTGCVKMQTVSALVNPAPMSSFTALPGTACVGQSVVVNYTGTADALASYFWNCNGCDQDPTDLGLIPGTPGPHTFTWSNAGPKAVTLDVTNSTGCPNLTQAVQFLTINGSLAAPTVATTTGTAIYACEGTPVTLTVTNAVQGVTYTWNGPNGYQNTQVKLDNFNALLTVQIVNATEMNNGFYTVTASQNGCSSLPVTVEVAVKALPIASFSVSKSTVCSGTELSIMTYTGTVPQNAIYSWFFDAGATPVGAATVQPDPQAVSWTTAGVKTVTLVVGDAVTAGLTCFSIAASQAITVLASPTAPTVSHNGPVCQGGTLMLSASPSVQGAFYSWTGPNNFASSMQNPTIPNVGTAAAGVYSLTVTLNGCTSGMVMTTPVIVNPFTISASATNSPICQGGTLNLTATSVANAAYLWTGPNGFNSSQQNPTLADVTTLNTGVYVLQVTAPGCGPATTSINVQVINPLQIVSVTSNSPVCAGTTLTLTASTVPGATYAWTGPNGFTSASSSPTVANMSAGQAGNYFLTVNLGGCTGTILTPVTVLARPARPNAGSNSPVCVGGTLILTSSLVPNTTYQWTGPNNFSSTLQNPTIVGVTSAASGTYSVVVISNSAGCASLARTVAVVINNPPTITTISSNSPVCIGNTINLTTGTIAGATYSWTGPNGFTSNAQNPSITNASAAQAGVYSLTVNQGGCVSSVATTTVNVTVAPTAPTITSNSPVCIGSTLQLTAGTVVGATYAWTGPAGFTSALQNPTIAAIGTANAGTYNLVVIVGGCASNVATTTVGINSAPPAPTTGNNGPLCVGNTISLTAAFVSGATYAWTGPAGFSSGLQNPIIPNSTAANFGTYTLVISVGGCASLPTTSAVNLASGTGTITASNNGALCSGQTLQLTATTVAGATYSWTGPNGFTSNVQNPTIANASTANAGVYAVTVNAAGGCNSAASTTVSINNSVAATASGPGTVCVGNPIGLNATTVSGATYAWTGPNGFTSAVQNPTINNATTANAGTYSLTVSLSGCSSGVLTTTVSIGSSVSAPTVGNNGPVCTGGTVLLTASTIAGANYSWSGPAGFVSTLQNPTVFITNVIQTGNYSVVVTVGGCTSQVNATFVTVNTPPAAANVGNNGAICEGNTLNLTASTVSGATYSWTGPNGFSSNLQNPSVVNATTANAGTYSLTVSTNGCVSAVSTTTASVNAAPTLALNNTTPVSCGGNNGAINVSASGVGGAPVTYTLTPSGLSNSTGLFSGLTNGSYTVTASANGCASQALPVTVSGAGAAEITSVVPGSANPSTSLTVTWTAVSGAASYNVRYRIAGSTGAYTTVSGLTGTSTTINGLTSSTSYEFGVQTVCAGGGSTSFSPAVTGTTGTSGCGIPANLAATVTSSSTATITWSPTSGAVCYIVSYGPVTTNPNLWPQFLVPHPGNTLVASGLLQGQQYGLRIRTNCSLCSTNSGIRSAWSNTVNFNTPLSKDGVATETQTTEAAFFTLYPNPNQGAFTISFDAAESGDGAIEVLDVTGRSVMQKTFVAVAGRNDLPVELTGQAAGVYQVRFTLGATQRTTRVVVK